MSMVLTGIVVWRKENGIINEIRPVRKLGSNSKVNMSKNNRSLNSLDFENNCSFLVNMIVMCSFEMNVLILLNKI